MMNVKLGQAERLVPLEADMLLNVFMWLGSRLFHYCDVYQDGEAVGITFSNDEAYVDRVAQVQ